jgi:flavin reductase (DIM6/NTAB) family NADH-FMN oxidoreductase RutF
MTIETKDISSNEIYNLMIGSILPRPIAWIGSKSINDVDNLAAFSFFSVASINPTVVSFSILNKAEGEQKATLKNIEDTKYFSISIVNEDLAKAMATSSRKYENMVDKFEVSKVTKKECSKIPSFYVSQSQISYECKLREIISFGDEDKAGNLVLADVIAINIDDEIINFPQIDIEKLKPIGRLSASYYSNIEDKFEIKKD